MPDLEYLMPEFLEAMNEIGRLGAKVHKIRSFHAQRVFEEPRGDYERYQSEVIAAHIRSHVNEYLQGIKHDKLGTFGHQLAAAAFNCMMEYYFARLAGEQSGRETEES